MHNASPATPINYWWNCAEGVWWPWYNGTDILFQDDLWDASLLGFQSSFSSCSGILRKSWWAFHYRLLLGRCFPGPARFVYCSAVWWSAADTHIRLLDRAVSAACFLTGGVFKCDIAHHRSVAVVHMLYKIRCNPLHSFLWCSTFAVCASAGSTGCSGRTLVYLCDSLLQNLAVPLFL